MISRYTFAAALALVLATYVTIFARQTHNDIDLPTWIDVSEWPATLLMLVAAWAAFTRRERVSALAMVAGLFAFVLEQGRFLFDLPLGFVLVSAGTLGFLWTLPVTWKVK